MRRARIVLLIALSAAAAMLVSCSGAAYETIMTWLGFDMKDYESEQMVRRVSEDENAYAEITRIIGILTLDNAAITPFESPRGASSGNRDAILNYMLGTGYAAYSGNSELLADAVEEYPQYNITTLIPEKDYESAVYRNFGGDESVTHESGVRYTYLPRVHAYTTTGQPLTVTVTLTVDSCVETEHTYRDGFTLTDESGESRSYNSMFMKREDETIYMRFLRESEK